ncbi:MAG: SDR family oxidoreductase [Burkholderiaceae bacterium]|nr:SDR family oxidoreductase [Burkholderiaceae bacterium]
MPDDTGSRVALVTGAAQGIGAAVAHALAARGMRVHLADLAEIPEGNRPPGAVAHRCDLGEREAVRAMVRTIEAAGDAIDVLVNAAGGVRGQVGRPIEQIDEASWHALFAANVDSAFWLAQAVAPGMQARGHGRIVFIASGAGLRPSLTGIQGYTAAKHALVGLTKQLSQDLGRFGITCNAVAPGFVRSNPATERQWEAYGEEGQKRLVESIHVRRLGSAGDIANAVMFFVDEKASWVCGQILSVDGGRS